MQAKPRPRVIYPAPIERVRESLRSAVRQILGCWILLSVTFMLLLDFTQGGPEDRNALWGMFLAAVFVFPVLGTYKLVKFALGY